MRLILFLFLVCNCTSCRAQPGKLSKKYSVGKFIVITDSCRDWANISVYKDSSVIYQNCFVDAFRVNRVDSVDLNHDGIPDFLFTLQMDDYSVLQILVSKPVPVSYEAFDLVDISSVELYSETQLQKGERVEDFVITTLPVTSQRVILTNVVIKGARVTPIKRFSDTLTFAEIQKKIGVD